MEERCDQFPNCDDFSDETDCNLIILPDNYVIDYAPFTVNASGTLIKVPVKIKVGGHHIQFDNIWSNFLDGSNFNSWY